MSADPTLVKFFEMKKKIISKESTSMGSMRQLIPTLVCFFEMKIFLFPKKFQVLDQVNFKKNYKCWISRIFFDIFWKNLQVLDQVQTF